LKVYNVQCQPENALKNNGVQAQGKVEEIIWSIHSNTATENHGLACCNRSGCRCYLHGNCENKPYR